MVHDIITQYNIIVIIIVKCELGVRRMTKISNFEALAHILLFCYFRYRRSP